MDYVDEEGKLYYFKYMLDGGEEGAHIPVATTRPETILGDAAVCVHPDDERCTPKEPNPSPKPQPSQPRPSPRP